MLEEICHLRCALEVTDLWMGVYDAGLLGGRKKCSLGGVAAGL
jgi:hypothetical protein